MESLGVMNLEGFGIDLEHQGLGPAGAVLVYAEDVLKGKPGNLTRIEEYSTGTALLLDPATQRNLEVFRTSAQTRKGSLLDSMDETVTSAGARLVEFSARPERDIAEIQLPQTPRGRNFPESQSGRASKGNIKIWSRFGANPRTLAQTGWCDLVN